MLLNNVFSNDKLFKRLFIVFLLAMFLLRIPLVTKGHMHFPDELRYRYAFMTVDGLLEGDIRQGLSYLFRSFNRPAFIILSIITVAIQRLFDRDVGKGDNIETDDLSTYAIPSIINVFACIGMIILLYLFLFYVTHDRFISFSGMVVYSMLNTSFMDIRHMHPYYLAQVLFFVLIYQVLIKRKAYKYTTSQIVFFGLATSLVFNIYPGYYNLAILIPGIMFFSTKEKGKIALLFTLSFMVLPVLFELISRYAGYPYLFETGKLKAVYSALPSGKAKVWELGWLFRYSLGIEGIVGGILFMLSMYFLIFILPKGKTNNDIEIIYLITIGVYIFIVLMIYFLGKFTLRTKYCYPYIFLMTIAAFLALNTIKKYKKVIISGLIVLSLVTFLFYYRGYLCAIYPRDLRQKVREDYPGTKIIHTAEFYPKNIQRAALYLAKRDKYDFLGVNLRTVGGPFAKRGEYNPINIDKRFEIMSYIYPEATYTPYAVEAMNFRRKKETKYKMRVYKLR